MQMTRLNDAPEVIRFSTESNAYLLIKQGCAILIDCPGPGIRAEIDRLNLPQPQAIIHTRVSEEQCREYEEFPDTPVYVPAEAKDLASLNDCFKQESNTVWADDRNWDSRGAEKYGYAGAMTVRPPGKSLNIEGTFEPGKPFAVAGFTFEVVDLHGAGKFAVGLALREEKIFFCGGLMQAGGFLDNIYDSVFCYARNDGLKILQTALGRAAKLDADKFLPLHGEAIDKPADDLRILRKQLQKVLRLTYLDWDGMNKYNVEPIREVGAFREILPGVYQNLSCGSVIIFIADDGNALLIDPDPALWLPSWQENVDAINGYLDVLEQETPLKSIEYALITHAHGDHVQFAEVLQERYNTKIVATKDVAELLRNPYDYPYACLLPWYNFHFKTLDCDIDLEYEVPFKWNSGDILPIHTPGHANAHAGFFLEWKGQRIVCTGDTVQHGGGTPKIQMPIIYNDTAWPELGPLVALKRIQKLHPDWVICGHSRYFHDPEGKVIAELIAVAEKVQNEVAKLVPPGELFKAMDPPGFATCREAIRHSNF